MTRADAEHLWGALDARAEVTDLDLPELERLLQASQREPVLYRALPEGGFEVRAARFETILRWARDLRARLPDATIIHLL